MSRQVFPQAPSPTMTSLRRISAMVSSAGVSGESGGRMAGWSWGCEAGRGRLWEVKSAGVLEKADAPASGLLVSAHVDWHSRVAGAFAYWLTGGGLHARGRAGIVQCYPD